MNFSDPSAATTILRLFASGLIAVPITVLFLTKTARPTSKKEKPSKQPFKPAIPSQLFCPAQKT